MAPDPASAPSLSWVPNRAVFLKRAMLTAIVTFVALLFAGVAASIYLDLRYIWALPSALLITLGFFIEDLLRWRATKYDHWGIDDGYLVHEGQEGTVRIPLTEVADVFTRFGGHVVIVLTSGKRILVSYQPFPKQTAKAIAGRKPE